MSLSVDYIRFLHKKVESLESENEVLKSGNNDVSRIPEVPKDDYSFTEYQQQKDRELEEQTQILASDNVPIKKEPIIPPNKLVTEQSLLEYENPELIFDDNNMPINRHISIDNSYPDQRLDSRLRMIPMTGVNYHQLRRPCKYTEHPIRKPLPGCDDIEEVGNWPVNFDPRTYIPPKMQNMIPPYVSYPTLNPYMNIPIDQNFNYRKPTNLGQDFYFYNNSECLF